MVNLTLYTMSCESNRVDKTAYIEEVASIVGDFRTSVSVSSPVVILSNEKLLKFNYAFIKELHRYYFVTDVTILSNGSQMVTLREDELFTFKDAIKAQKALVLRNENDYNADMPDPLMVSKMGKDSYIFALEDAVDFYNYNHGHSVVFMGVK